MNSFSQVIYTDLLSYCKVAKWVREQMAETSHFFDIWHIGKSKYVILLVLVRCKGMSSHLLIVCVSALEKVFRKHWMLAQRRGGART